MHYYSFLVVAVEIGLRTVPSSLLMIYKLHIYLENMKSVCWYFNLAVPASFGSESLGAILG